MSEGPYDARIIWDWHSRPDWCGSSTVRLTLQRETGPLRWNACINGRCAGGRRTPWGALYGAWKFDREAKCEREARRVLRAQAAARSARGREDAS